MTWTRVAAEDTWWGGVELQMWFEWRVDRICWWFRYEDGKWLVNGRGRLEPESFGIQNQGSSHHQSVLPTSTDYFSPYSLWPRISPSHFQYKFFLVTLHLWYLVTTYGLMIKHRIFTWWPCMAEITNNQISPEFQMCSWLPSWTLNSQLPL